MPRYQYQSTPLSDSHRHLYRQEPCPPFSTRELYQHAGAIFIGIVVATLSAPLWLSARGSHHSYNQHSSFFDDVVIKIVVGGIAATCTGGRIFWKTAWQPWWAARHDHQLVGEFTVQEKGGLLYPAIWLTPGDDHQLSVTDKQFQELEPGDRVQVIYASDSQFISLQKLQASA